jgi:hypothetical protein
VIAHFINVSSIARRNHANDEFISPWTLPELTLERAQSNVSHTANSMVDLIGQIDSIFSSTTFLFLAV